MPRLLLPLVLITALLGISPLRTLAQEILKGDIDGNGKVDILDYNIVVENFGRSTATVTPTPFVTAPPTASPTPRLTSTPPPVPPSDEIVLGKITHTCTPLRARLSWTSSQTFPTYFINRCQGPDCTEFELLGKSESLFYDDTQISANTSYTYFISTEESGTGTVSKSATVNITCTLASPTPDTQ